MPVAFAIALKIRADQEPSRATALAHGAMAPSRIEREASGTTRSGSISRRSPSPLHSGHIPSGLLKEKLCGESSGKAWPQQVRLSLKRIGGNASSGDSTVISP
jgi:hypothetical protein